MNFHNPLALVWALLLPAIILLYFLKLKRVEMPISSTYLWKKSIQDMRVNALFQRLRRNFLLFLQLLILAAAILALAQPYLDVRGFERTSKILLIDRSASMTAVSRDGTRLDEAKQKALRIVDDMSSGDDVAVIVFSTTARVVSPFTSSKATLRGAIDKIQPTEGRSAITGALEIASSLARLRQNPEVILLSDGRFVGDSDASLEQATLEYWPIGEASANVGITSLDLRRGLDIGGDVEAFVRLENFSDEPATVKVSLSIEGEPFDATEVEVPAKDARSRVFTGLGEMTGEQPRLLEVRIESDVEDALAADDLAYAILEPPRPLKVGMVTDGNYFVDRLLQLDPEIYIETASAAEVLGEAGLGVFAGHEPGVVILDRVVPASLPSGNYLIFRDCPPVEGFVMEGQVEDPVVLDWEEGHPAIRFANFDTLQVQKAGRLTPPRGAETLLESDSGPLIVAYESEGIRIVFVNFDIYESNWPLRLSFPIFVSNAVRFLAGKEGIDFPRQLRTGEVITVPMEGREEVVVERPDGERETIRADGAERRFFEQTDRAGLYRLRAPGGAGDAGAPEEVYAVNLLDSAESDLVPADSVTISEREVEGGQGTLESNREIWRPLVLLALLVLLVEWYIYNRRVHI